MREAATGNDRGLTLPTMFIPARWDGRSLRVRPGLMTLTRRVLLSCRSPLQSVRTANLVAL
jgi:hypothetical protein